jgi:hypothetical protein
MGGKPVALSHEGLGLHGAIPKCGLLGLGVQLVQLS